MHLGSLCGVTTQYRCRNDLRLRYILAEAVSHLLPRSTNVLSKGYGLESVRQHPMDARTQQQWNALKELYGAVTWLGRQIAEEAPHNEIVIPTATIMNALAQKRKAIPNRNHYRREGEDEHTNEPDDIKESDDSQLDTWRRAGWIQEVDRAEESKLFDKFGSSKTGREVVVKDPQGKEVPYVPTRTVPCAFQSGDQAWIVNPTISTLDERCGVGMYILKAFAQATRTSLADVWKDAVYRDSKELHWTHGLYEILGFQREGLKETDPYESKGVHAQTYRQHSAFSHHLPGREGDAGLYCMVMSARWQRLHREAFLEFQPDDMPDFVGLFDEDNRPAIEDGLKSMKVSETESLEDQYTQMKAEMNVRDNLRRKKLVDKAFDETFGAKKDWEDSVKWIFDSSRVTFLRDRAEALARLLFPESYVKGQRLSSNIKTVDDLLVLSEARRRIRQWLHDSYFPAMEQAEPWDRFVAPAELDLTWGNLLTPPLFSIATCDALARMDTDMAWFCWKLLYNPGPESQSGDGPFLRTPKGLELAKPKRVPLRRQVVKRPMPHIAFHVEDSPYPHEIGAVKLLHPNEYEKFENRSSGTRSDRRFYVGAIAHLGINKKARALSEMIRPLDLRLDFFQALQRRLRDSPTELAELRKYTSAQPPHYRSLALLPRRVWAVADYGFAQMPDFLTPSDEGRRDR